jgi:hypothetical protein
MPHVDPEARRAWQRDWYARNRERIRDYFAAYRVANGPRLLEVRAAWRHRTRGDRSRYRLSNKCKFLLYHAKSRAKKAGLPFNLTVEALYWPALCPVYGFPLDYCAHKSMVDNAPTLDRIDSSGGYVVGNVQVISWLANRLKSNATLAELQQLVRYMELFN